MYLVSSRTVMHIDVSLIVSLLSLHTALHVSNSNQLLGYTYLFLDTITAVSIHDNLYSINNAIWLCESSNSSFNSIP